MRFAMNSLEITRVIGATAVALRKSHYSRGAKINLAYAMRNLKAALTAAAQDQEVVKDFSLRMAEMFMEFAVAEEKHAVTGR
jgi:hypothetical protein